MKIIKSVAASLAAVAITMCAVSMVSSRSASAPASQEEFISAAEGAINGVVSVKCYATTSPRSYYTPYDDPFMEFFFGGAPQRQPQQQEPQERPLGLGSGVIISEDGYIVTNNHVIDGADRVEVTLNDNRCFDGVVIGSDPDTDLALIKIEASDLHPIKIGNSEDLRVGEWVLAVGNPFGFTSTVTSGIVSAKGRNISSATQRRAGASIESYIQTDAALNAGNSGGALVNLDGELVGINTAIYSQTGNYAGCSFAIPTSIVSKVVADIKDYGTVQRARLGIEFVELTPEIIRQEGIEGVNAGIYVARVGRRTAASDAGLAEGDVITAINGHPTHNIAQIQEAMATCSPGQQATIEYYRDGSPRTRTATLRSDRQQASR